MEVEELGIPGPRLIVPTQHVDERGFLSEVYNARTLAGIGITEPFVQENHILSVSPGTVRGLHFQLAPHDGAKLVRVLRGEILDVALDVRPDSETFGQHVSVRLDTAGWGQLYIPAGFAHGFCTLEPDTEVAYKSTSFWNPKADRGVAWNDPDLGIEWPVTEESAIVSVKDRSQPSLHELKRELG